MDDYATADPTSDSPEVTISPADNGHVVRWHQRSTKKDEPGRTVKRVASSVDDALGHAKDALSGGGAGRTRKKSTSTSTRSLGRDGTDAAEAGEAGGSSTSPPAAHSKSAIRPRGLRRRPVRSRRRG